MVKANGNAAVRAAEVPPSNEDAEKALLGSIMLSPEKIDDVADVVNPEDFYSAVNAEIYRTLQDMAAKNLPLDDTVALAEQLEAKGVLQQIDGGAMYLLGVLESVPHGAHAVYYGELVADKAIRRQIIYASNKSIEDAYSQHIETGDLVSTVDGRFASISEQTVKSTASDIRSILLDAMDAISEGRKRGLMTGFCDIDKLVHGLLPGTLTIIAARPSMGKTAFVGNLAVHTARANVPTLFFSLEQTKFELAERLLCSMARIDSNKVKSGDLEEFERHKLLEASSTLSEYPLFIDEEPARNMMQISAVSRRFKRRNRIGMVIVDYLQIIEPDDRRSPREQQVSAISRKLKGLAKSLSVPVVCLAQLNRAVESRDNKHPRLSDLRESGSIEQDADMVWFLHREAAFDPGSDPTQAELIVAKHRGGTTGRVKLHWNGPTMTFKNAARDDADYGDQPDYVDAF